MSDATALLSTINDKPFDASSNPGGLADSGYLQEVGGLSLVARVARAMASATEEVQAVSYDVAAVTSDAAAIVDLIEPAEAKRDAAAVSAAAAHSAASGAAAAVPTPFQFSLI